MDVGGTAMREEVGGRVKRSVRHTAGCKSPPSLFTLQNRKTKNITLNGKAFVQSFCLNNSLYSEYSALWRTLWVSPGSNGDIFWRVNWGENIEKGYKVNCDKLLCLRGSEKRAVFTLRDIRESRGMNLEDWERFVCGILKCFWMEHFPDDKVEFRTACGGALSPMFSPLIFSMTPSPSLILALLQTASSCRLDMQLSWRVMKVFKQIGWGADEWVLGGRRVGLGWEEGGKEKFLRGTTKYWMARPV